MTVSQGEGVDDTKRMDFIEAHVGWLRVSFLGHKRKQGWICDEPFKQDWMDVHTSARAAVDAAIERNARKKG